LRLFFPSAGIGDPGCHARNQHSFEVRESLEAFEPLPQKRLRRKTGKESDTPQPD
jgi:hypothetical protein